MSAPTEQARPAPRGPGTRVGDHVLVRLLGRGGMGEVWEAEHAPTGARRALKLLPAGAAGAEELLRFRREAEAQARVDAHPNVVRVHAAGEHQGGLWLALDLVEGGDLEQRLQAGPLEPRVAATLVRDLARGLAHVHARGVLHRDLKPANVLFAPDGTPRLADFGLARLTGAESLTRTGEVLGTPAYMAPEQARGGHVDARADVYGLGAVLYRALTGEVPFPAQGALAQLAQVLQGSLRPPRQLRPDVPHALEGICLAALVRDPERRTPSAAALGDALQAWLETETPGRVGRGPLPAALAGVAAGLALLAVALRVQSPGPATGPGVAPASSSQPTPAPGPSTAPPPAPVAWTVRIAAELAGPVPRPATEDGTRAACDARAKTAWRRHQAAPDLHQLREALAPELEVGSCLAQRYLGLSYLQGPTPDPAQAAEWLWAASRGPHRDREAGLCLVTLLGRGGTGLVADPAAARLLLDDLVRTGDIDPFRRACVEACTGPGGLGRGLARLVAHRESEDLRRKLRGLQEWEPAAPLFLALGTLEGWGPEPAEPGLAWERISALLNHPDGPPRRLACAWLQLAAAAGSPAAREHLRLAKVPRLELTALDPCDLLGLDGTRVVGESRGGDQGLERLMGLRSRFDGSRPREQGAPTRAHLRALAEERLVHAMSELGHDLLDGLHGPRDRQEALRWLALAALEPPAGQGYPGAPRAWVTLGRCRLLGLGWEPDVQEAARLLGEGLERLTRLGADERPRNVRFLAEARVWLALLRLSGRGGLSPRPGDEAEVETAVGELLEPGRGELAVILRQAAPLDPWAAWAYVRTSPGLDPDEVRLLHLARAELAGVGPARVDLERRAAEGPRRARQVEAARAAARAR